MHQAQRFRRWYHDRIVALFDTIDAIVAPATPGSAFPLGTDTMTVDGVSLPARPNVGMFTQPISFVGLPVVAVPVAIESALPVAVQVIAAPWREDVCMRIAAALEAAGVAHSRRLAWPPRP